MTKSFSSAATYLSKVLRAKESLFAATSARIVVLSARVDMLRA